jgi:hypothetical protein
VIPARVFIRIFRRELGIYHTAAPSGRIFQPETVDRMMLLNKPHQIADVRKSDEADHGPALSSRLPPPLEGISLAGFRAFFELHGGFSAFTDLPTTEVKTALVLPATTPQKCAYSDLLRATPGAVGPANAFLSHSYSGKVIDAYDAAAAWEERQSSG